MLPLGDKGALAPLEGRKRLAHVGVKLVLPLGKLRPAAQNLLGGQSPVLGDGREAQVQMGRFLVHVNHGRKDISPAHFPLHECRRRVCDSVYAAVLVLHALLQRNGLDLLGAGVIPFAKKIFPYVGVPWLEVLGAGHFPHHVQHRPPALLLDGAAHHRPYGRFHVLRVEKGYLEVRRQVEQGLRAPAPLPLYPLI